MEVIGRTLEQLLRSSLGFDTSRHLCYVNGMAIGQSRRIVIDLDDVELKRSLYSALAQDGRSLKEWFVGAASHYLNTRRQSVQLEFGALRVAQPPSEYVGSESSHQESEES